MKKQIVCWVFVNKNFIVSLQELNKTTVRLPKKFTILISYKKESLFSKNGIQKPNFAYSHRIAYCEDIGLDAIGSNSKENTTFLDFEPKTPEVDAVCTDTGVNIYSKNNVRGLRIQSKPYTLELAKPGSLEEISFPQEVLLHQYKVKINYTLKGDSEIKTKILICEAQDYCVSVATLWDRLKNPTCAPWTILGILASGLSLGYGALLGLCDLGCSFLPSRTVCNTLNCLLDPVWRLICWIWSMTLAKLFAWIAAKWRQWRASRRKQSQNIETGGGPTVSLLRTRLTALKPIRA